MFSVCQHFYCSCRSVLGGQTEHDSLLLHKTTDIDRDRWRRREERERELELYETERKEYGSIFIFILGK